MPFIQCPINNEARPVFYTITAVAPHVGVSWVVQKWAERFVAQNKKVLIFDALLGLKNFPQNYSISDKILKVLDGTLPLINLVTSNQKGIDVIAGIASQNLNATSLPNLERIKNDLQQLALNYDVVLIDSPAAVITNVFQNFGNHVWVSNSNQAILLKTLRHISCDSEAKLIFNQVENETEYRNLYLFTKNLLPKCQLIEFFE